MLEGGGPRGPPPNSLDPYVAPFVLHPIAEMSTMRDRRTYMQALSVSLPLAALAAVGCSPNQVLREHTDRGPIPNCDGLGVPAIACATGRTVPVCTLDAGGRAFWRITCPDQPDASVMTGAGGAAGGSDDAGAGGAGGSGRAGKPCASTESCDQQQVCTTEDGVCNPPPGCGGPNVACPAVCYGECRTASAGATCAQDDDCHLGADYCNGCDCRALAKGETVPRCPGPGVQCLIDPCGRLAARCVNGRCSAQ